MKMSTQLIGDGLIRALRRISHRANESGQEARRAARAKEKPRTQGQERYDARRRN